MRSARLATLGLVLSSVALVSSQRSTEQEEATIPSATAECTDYDYPPAGALANDYPTIWETASVSFSGVPAYDAALFASLSPSIPDIAPKGTGRDGDFDGVVYDTTTDPDCWWTETQCDTPKTAGIAADTTQCDEPNTYGFTLDDGPNCSHNAYYDYLQTINQKATLFYIGSNVFDWPLEGQRGLADGHEICAHTWSHPYMTQLTNEEVFAELYYSKKAIKDLIGVTVKCWRPPFGDVDDRVRYIANFLDMRTIVWEEDTFDWDYATIGIPAVQANYQTILTSQSTGKYNSSGPIVLSHELDGETMSLNEEFLPNIIKQFTGGVMPVAVCTNNTQPYAEGDAYVYPNYAEWVAGTRTVSLLAPTAVSRDIELAFTSGGPGSSWITGPAPSSSPSSSAPPSSSSTGSSAPAIRTASLAGSSASGSAASATKAASSAGSVRVGGVAGAMLVAVGVFSAFL